MGHEKINRVNISCICVSTGFVEWVRSCFDTRPTYIYAVANKYTFTNKYTNSTYRYTHSNCYANFRARPYRHTDISPYREFCRHLAKC